MHYHLDERTVCLYSTQTLYKQTGKQNAKTHRRKTEFHGLHQSSLADKCSVTQLLSQRLDNKWTYLIADNIKMSQKLEV